MSNNLHRYLEFSKAKPLKTKVANSAAHILNSYTHGYQNWLSPNQYRKLDKIVMSAGNSPFGKSLEFRFDDLVSHIQLSRDFNSSCFGLPAQNSFWLDSSPSISLEGPLRVVESREPLKLLSVPLGKDFKIQPVIDRAGVAFATCQPLLQENILTSFNRLVMNSNEALELGKGDWFHNLRMMITDCVSLVDISLHQLYYKARFDPTKVSKKDGMRIREKFCWVYQITGMKLDDVAGERKSFNLLKSIRNHLNHFDPPYFAFLLQEVADWMNRVSDIGTLLWKIRERMQEPVNRELVRMIALPIVEFNPKFEEPQLNLKTELVGWKSCTRPEPDLQEPESNCPS